MINLHEVYSLSCSINHKSCSNSSIFSLRVQFSSSFFSKITRIARPRGSNKFNRFVKCHITHTRDLNFTTNASKAVVWMVKQLMRFQSDNNNNNNNDDNDNNNNNITIIIIKSCLYDASLKESLQFNPIWSGPFFWVPGPRVGGVKCPRLISPKRLNILE